jgi:hypothetical protein
MYMKDTYTTLAFIFIIVIFICALFSSSSSSRFNMPLFSNIYPYEGFHQRLIPLNYTSVNDPSNAFDDTTSIFSIQSKMLDCKKVSGFDGMGVFCTPTTPENKIDIYSQAEGKLDCKSYGYSNSKGGLCMDKIMINQLQSRGGNATGKDSQIGSSY